MKEQFRNWNPKPETLLRLRDVKEVLARYEGKFRLTLRQLYYQLVAADKIDNFPKEYARLGDLLSNARYAGLIDWDIIEDRGRVPRRPSDFENIKDLVDTAISAYRLPRWSDQKFYVELWCEKDALSSVIEPITRANHVFLMVNRGYSSSSAMYESANRLKEAARLGKHTVILYLGDFDPSGEDMVRDIEARMVEFEVNGSEDGFYEDDEGEPIELAVKKIALTPDQIREYKPPPNTAKETDSRYKAFKAKHGLNCYEVDALRPEVLQQLIRDEIDVYIDVEKWNVWLEREKKEAAKLKKLAKKI